MDVHMKKLLLTITVLIFLGHAQAISQTRKSKKKVQFNQQLADELKAMAEVDQIAAYIPQGKYKEWSVERWEDFKDSVFTTHKKRMEEIFAEFGYPGYNLVGKTGSQHFWLMVQHCDSDPAFQLSVLEKLKIEVGKSNADASNFGLLTDRVKINTGEKQIFGTQVAYNSFGQAYPKNLADSVNVNKRRAEVGLEPIEQYLNVMTQMHFEMNKEYLKSKGISAPILYNTHK
jgi:hypothetical protein